LAAVAVVSGLLWHHFVRAKPQGPLKDGPVVATLGNGPMGATPCVVADAMSTDDYSFREGLSQAADQCYGYINAMPSPTGRRVLAHTALWPAPDTDKAVFAKMVEKVRVMVMSFLATQREDAELRFWVRTSGEVGPMRDALRLAGVSGEQQVVFRAFEAIDIVKPGSAERIDVGWVLNVQQASRLPRALDVARYMMLDAYGGIWLDADTVVLRELSPLVGLAFGYTTDWNDQSNFWQKMGVTPAPWLHGQFVNNAVIGVEREGSCLTQELLARVAEKQQTFGSYFEFGPFLFMNMTENSFHPVPGCFFEPASASEGLDPALLAPPVEELFEETAQSAQHASMLQSGMASFTYHWHNRWDEDFAPGSAFAILANDLNQRLR